LPRVTIDFAKGQPLTDLPSVSYFNLYLRDSSFFSRLKIEETSHSRTPSPPAPFTHSSRVSWIRKYSCWIGRRSNCHREQLRRSIFTGIKVARVSTPLGRMSRSTSLLSLRKLRDDTVLRKDVFFSNRFNYQKGIHELQILLKIKSDECVKSNSSIFI